MLVGLPTHILLPLSRPYKAYAIQTMQSSFDGHDLTTAGIEISTCFEMYQTVLTQLCNFPSLRQYQITQTSVARVFNTTGNSSSESIMKAKQNKNF
jgi:hypothetical protein